MDGQPKPVHAKYLDDASVQDILRMAVACAAWGDANMVGLEINTDGVNLLAATAFGIVHEHHGAIVSLLLAGRLGSGLALLRPTFEALVRGIWLLRGSKDTQIELYLAGKDSKKIEGLLKDLRKGPQSAEDAFLQATWTKSERSLHQFTHVSHQMLIRRWSFDVETAMPMTEVVDAIKFATGAALLASIELARLALHLGLEQHAMRLLSVLYPMESPFAGQASSD